MADVVLRLDFGNDCFNEPCAMCYKYVEPEPHINLFLRDKPGRLCPYCAELSSPGIAGAAKRMNDCEDVKDAHVDRSIAAGQLDSDWLQKIVARNKRAAAAAIESLAEKMTRK